MLRPIEDYVRLRRERGREALRAEITGPMLAIFASNVVAKSSFRTSTVTKEVAQQAGELALATTELSGSAEGAYAAQIRKAPGSPWENRISVGRARNSDVCIPDPSLSKLHAHLLITDDGDYRVSDPGSKNGTLVNKLPVEPGTSKPIVPGDVIHFGGVVAVFHSADTFVRYVRMLDSVLKHAEEKERKRRERRELRKAQQG